MIFIKWRPFIRLINKISYHKSCSESLLRKVEHGSPCSYRTLRTISQYHTHSSQRIVKQLDNKPLNTNPVIPRNENSQGESKEYTLKSIKYSLLCLGICIIGTGSYLVLKYGSPPCDETGRRLRDEFSKLPIYLQYLYRTLREVENFTLFIQRPSREKLLPDPVTFPYQQPKYTLVLELTDVLVHPDWTYNTGWRFKKRPGLNYLLDSLAGMYEIVVFTAEQGTTVFPLVEALDTKNLISYKLVRDATHFTDGHHVKDLEKLNRDLSKVIVIDWNNESVKFHNENLFNIGKWDGNDNDNSLVDLTSFLTTIAQNEVEDVRDVLSYYKTFDNPLKAFRQKQKEILEETQRIQSPKPLIGKRSYFF